MCFMDTARDGPEQGTGDLSIQDRREGLLVPRTDSYLTTWDRTSKYYKLWPELYSEFLSHSLRCEVR